MSGLFFANRLAAEKPSFFEQTRENISNFFGDAQDFAQLVGAFLDFISGFLNYLGLFGFFLFVITMVLLSITNAVSPLGKLSNYITVCAFVSLTYLLNAAGTSGGASALVTILRYLSVMAAPLILTYGVQFIVSSVSSLMGRNTTQKRLTRIRGLAQDILQQAG